MTTIPWTIYIDGIKTHMTLYSFIMLVRIRIQLRITIGFLHIYTYINTCKLSSKYVYEFHIYGIIFNNSKSCALSLHIILYYLFHVFVFIYACVYLNYYINTPLHWCVKGIFIRHMTTVGENFVDERARRGM